MVAVKSRALRRPCRFPRIDLPSSSHANALVGGLIRILRFAPSISGLMDEKHRNLAGFTVRELSTPGAEYSRLLVSEAASQIAKTFRCRWAQTHLWVVVAEVECTGVLVTLLGTAPEGAKHTYTMKGSIRLPAAPSGLHGDAKSRSSTPTVPERISHFLQLLRGSSAFHFCWKLSPQIALAREAHSPRTSRLNS